MLTRGQCSASAGTSSSMAPSLRPTPTATWPAEALRRERVWLSPLRRATDSEQRGVRRAEPPLRVLERASHRAARPDRADDGPAGELAIRRMSRVRMSSFLRPAMPDLRAGSPPRTACSPTKSSTPTTTLPRRVSASAQTLATRRRAWSSATSAVGLAGRAARLALTRFVQGVATSRM